MGFVYLAAPYRNPDLVVQKRRAVSASEMAAKLMEAGFTVFSPISQGVSLKPHIREDLRDNFEFWIPHDLVILSNSSALFVLCLDGWAYSRGVREEINKAELIFLPTEYIKGDADVETLVRKYPHLIHPAAKGTRPGEAAGTS